MHESEKLTSGPVCLIIMDGFGIDEPGKGNAISLAKTPCLDQVFAQNPHMLLQASGEYVGLPDGQMGNSEVGHLNIGAGRVVFQELTRINNACKSGELSRNEVLRAAFENAKGEGRVLHLMGLLSDGGVHSNNAHLYALMEMAVEMGIPRVHVHCFMDGRDVPPASGKGYILSLQEKIRDLSGKGTAISIASIHGRYYAMDRDNRWDRVAQAYDCLVGAQALSALSPDEFMQASYDEGITDEFVVPGCFDPRGVTDGDSVVFFNFRPDRAREITRAIVEADFKGFERSLTAQVSYVCLTEYDPTIDAPVAFAKEFPGNVLADVLAQAGLRQYHIAETEKYAHVTFFLNGGREEPKRLEHRELIPSPKVATYDLQPEMSAPEVSERLHDAILADEAEFYVVNFANCDMVGHTGVIPAAVAAVEAVDAGVALVLSALQEKGGRCLLTADHGNADKMIAADGSPHTAHTTAPVPLALIEYGDAADNRLEDAGDGAALCDIAPTILALMGLKQPLEMTGKSLLA